MNFRQPFLFALGVALLLSSCAAPSFKKEFAASVSTNPPPHADITGPWTGQWLSDHNGHSGDLRCIVKEIGPGRYNFLYHATWGRGLKGSFSIDCTAETVGGVTLVKGEKNILGTTYNHDGAISTTTFDAKFGSDKKDFGNFRMSRPVNSEQ